MAAKKTNADNDTENANTGDAPENTTTMTPEQLDEAVKKANFSIQEAPEKPNAVQPAMMFDADTKITPALIMKKVKEEEARRKKKAQAAPETNGPREEKRNNGRRVIRHN